MVGHGNERLGVEIDHRKLTAKLHALKGTEYPKPGGVHHNANVGLFRVKNGGVFVGPHLAGKIYRQRTRRSAQLGGKLLKRAISQISSSSPRYFSSILRANSRPMPDDAPVITAIFFGLLIENLLFCAFLFPFYAQITT